MLTWTIRTLEDHLDLPLAEFIQKGTYAIGLRPLFRISAAMRTGFKAIHSEYAFFMHAVLYSTEFLRLSVESVKLLERDQMTMHPMPDWSLPSVLESAMPIRSPVR